MLRSVLIHLLPGLALFTHRFCAVPEAVMQVWQYFTGAAAPAPGVLADTPVSFFWISGAPLLFYAAWQLMYFFIVQAGSPPASHAPEQGCWRRPAQARAASHKEVACSADGYKWPLHVSGLLPGLHSTQWLRHQLQCAGQVWQQHACAVHHAAPWLA